MIRFLGLALALQASGGRGVKKPVATPADPRPNVIVLVADDLGYADLGVLGLKEVATPNIDRVFREGVRFTDGYMSSSLCSPSRAGILTGRYQERFGHDFNPGEAGTDSADFKLPSDMPTVAQYLKPLGYATAIVGKWHLGVLPEARPLAHGFDEFFGFLGREHWYTRNRLTHDFEPLWHGDREVTDTTYLTRSFAREAVSFIERHAAAPFFLYVPFNAVHVPMQEDSATVSRVSGVTLLRRRQYLSMLASMDDAVGQVLATLDRLQLAQKTLVVFMSDNGGPTDMTTANNGTLRGLKGTLFEGGIRVPFAMRWPGRLPAGTTYSEPITSLDVAPTVIAVAGGDPSKIAFDGVDLFPFLSGQRGATPPHQRLFWRQGYKFAVREGRFKLLSSNLMRKPQLYDLTADPGEANSVFRPNKVLAKKMEAEYHAWNKDMQRPRGLLPGFLGVIQQWFRNRKED